MGVRFTDDPPISPLTPTPSFGLMGAIDRRPSFTPSIDDRDMLPSSSSAAPKPAPALNNPHTANERNQGTQSTPGESSKPNNNLFENRNDNGTNPFTKNKQKSKNPFGNYRDNYSNNYSNLNAGKDVSDDEDEVSRNLKAQVSHHIFPTRKADPVNDGGFPEAVNPDICDRSAEGLIPVEPNTLAAPVVQEPAQSPAPSYKTMQSDAYRPDMSRGEMSRGPDMHRADSFRPDVKQDMSRADSHRGAPDFRQEMLREQNQGPPDFRQEMLRAQGQGPPDFRQEMLRSESFRQQGMLGSDNLRPEPSRAPSFRSEVSRADTFKPAEYRSDTLRVDSYRPEAQRSHSFSGESTMPDSASRMGSVDGTVTPLHLLRDQSDTVDCPFCRRRVQTRIEKKASAMTHVTATTLFLTTIAGGVAPYAAKWQSNIHHYCTNCNRKVAVKRHGRKMAEPLGTPDHLREQSKFETSGSRW